MSKITDLKRQLQDNNISGLAIDIDETLSFTLKYWFTNMVELFGDPEQLGVLGLIKKYRYAINVPYWQTPTAKQWMTNQVYSNEVQTKLDVIGEADKYVKELIKIMPIAVYLTVRPEEVLPGTKSWLKAHNFPTAPILARPNHIQHQDGNIWKAEVLNELFPEISGIVDDNYEVLKYLPDAYQGNFFLYSMKNYVHPPHKVICCPTWPDVITAVKNTY
jgi:hypothetical protein